jgi:hypothetical protein
MKEQFLKYVNEQHNFFNVELDLKKKKKCCKKYKKKGTPCKKCPLNHA